MLEATRSIWCWIITFWDYLSNSTKQRNPNTKEEDMSIDKNFYNESSAKNLGWDPSWFGQKYFDEQLVRAIKKWQKANGLNGDGLCGPMTYRRIWTERQADIDDYKPVECQYSNYIVYNGEFHPIEWDKVVLWSEVGGMKAKKGSYYDYTGRPKRGVRLLLTIGMFAFLLDLVKLS